MMELVGVEVHMLATFYYYFEVNNLHHYQVDVFYAVIDMELQVLSHRFNEVNTRLHLPMACLCPSESYKSFNLEKLMEMATFYHKEFPTENDLQLLQLELQDYIKDVRVDEDFNHLKSLRDLSKMTFETKRHIIYPKMYLLFKLALILPVAKSSVESAFSAMKLINSDLCNKVSADFMNDCLVSYIDKKDSIGNEELMKHFQGQKDRRVVL